MKLPERQKRDADIMKLLGDGMTPLKIARKYRLTLSRVNQIIQREQCQSIFVKRSHARAAKARKD